MSFGDNLRALRKTFGLSRRELAVRLNVPYTTLRNYEMDQREPGHDMLKRMSRLFCVSVDTLIDNDMENVPPLPDESMKISHDFDVLDIYGKNVVRAVIREELKRLDAEKAARESAESTNRRPVISAVAPGPEVGKLAEAAVYPEAAGALAAGI
ncbi:MAG: helix-turn-helix domain-containing protein [Oscillospiraceae bacterium]